MSQATLALTGATAGIAPALDGFSAAELEAAYGVCREVTRARARNFFYGLRLTPEPRRSAVYSIYAWMRAADDEADAEADQENRHARFGRFRALTERVLGGDLSAAPRPSFWPAFAATVRSYPIDHRVIRSMLDGLEADLDHRGYETLEELEHYCYCVGSTVGLTCVNIWGLAEGVDPQAARVKAEARGKAFQLTNILRDVAQDFDGSPSRVYLPAEVLDGHGLTAEGLRRWADPARCRSLMMAEAGRAEALYAASEGLEGMIDPACAPALWGMTRIYHGLLEVILADPARPFTGRRVRLSSARKFGIALQALMRSRTGRW